MTQRLTYCSSNVQRKHFSHTTCSAFMKSYSLKSDTQFIRFHIGFNSSEIMRSLLCIARGQKTLSSRRLRFQWDIIKFLMLMKRMIKTIVERPRSPQIYITQIKLYGVSCSRLVNSRGCLCRLPVIVLGQKEKLKVNNDSFMQVTQHATRSLSAVSEIVMNTICWVFWENITLKLGSGNITTQVKQKHHVLGLK